MSLGKNLILAFQVAVEANVKLWNRWWMSSSLSWGYWCLKSFRWILAFSGFPVSSVEYLAIWVATMFQNVVSLSVADWAGMVFGTIGWICGWGSIDLVWKTGCPFLLE